MNYPVTIWKMKEIERKTDALTSEEGKREPSWAKFSSQAYVPNSHIFANGEG